MKRSPLKRRTPLVARTTLKRGKPLKRESVKQARREKELRKSKEIVRERSGGKCEVPGCLRRANHFHHKRLRSQGGGHEPENLMHLCAPHHRQAHENPTWANELGIISRRTDPDPDEQALGESLVTFDATTFCDGVAGSSDSAPSTNLGGGAKSSA